MCEVCRQGGKFVAKVWNGNLVGIMQETPNA
jgi:hypothetical protein